MSLFVTGTDTGVGKTHTVTQLLRLQQMVGRRCAGMKPICCGDREDAQLLLAAGCDGLTIDEINPIWLKTPVAPLTAAEIENFQFDLEALLQAFRSLVAKVEAVFVEGVGGWLVPIAPDFSVEDLAAALGLPVLVVAENKLGCLNHTLLTVRSVQRRGLVCAGVVLNEVGGQSDIAQTTNWDVLRRLCPVPILGGFSENDRILTPDWAAILQASAANNVSAGETQV